MPTLGIDFICFCDIVFKVLSHWQEAIMYLKTLCALLFSCVVTGCVGDVVVNSYTEVRHYPSRMQEKFPRGQEVFACTTVAGIYEYLERGAVSRGCGWVPMSAARYRSDMQTSAGDYYRIVEFHHGFDMFFTFEHKHRHRHRFAY